MTRLEIPSSPASGWWRVALILAVFLALVFTAGIFYSAPLDAPHAGTAAELPTYGGAR